MLDLGLEKGYSQTKEVGMKAEKIICEYCFYNEAITQTDMMDFVCQPCLIGKPLTELEGAK
jgi:hypothetical protein